MATLAERIEQARAAKVAAEGLLDLADKAEILAREELDRLEEERRVAERAKRDLDLSRRLDAAQEAHPGEKFRALSIKEFPDTFIVRRCGAAHKKWEKKVGEFNAGNRKIDTQEIAVMYAIECVYEWNGKIVGDASSTHGYDLIQYLKANHGIVTPITNTATELNGLHAEERKSSGR